MRNFRSSFVVALVVGLFAETLLAQDAWAECEFLPVSSVNCPASLSPQEAAFCGIWGEGYFEFAGGKLPHCLAVEISDGKSTIWYATGQHTTQRSRTGYSERKAQVKGEVLTASWSTRLPGGLIEVEYRRDGDVLRGKYMRNNRTSLVTLPRFGK